MCHIETGFQLFARLCTRTNLNNFYPEVFLGDGPRPQHVVEILGDTCSGKTLMVTELVAKCILPETVDSVNVDGKNAGAIVVNTDHHFHLFKVINTMETVLRNSRVTNGTVIENVIMESLKNLYVLNCYDSQQMYLSFHHLQNILAINRNVALVAIDSLFAYYWVDRLNDGFRKMNLYQKNYLKILQNLTKDYNVVVIFTKATNFLSNNERLEDCCHEATLERINYRIHLNRNKDNYSAQVTLPDNKKFTKQFKINKLIEWSDQDTE